MLILCAFTVSTVLESPLVLVAFLHPGTDRPASTMGYTAQHLGRGCDALNIGEGSSPTAPLECSQ